MDRWWGRLVRAPGRLVLALAGATGLWTAAAPADAMADRAALEARVAEVRRQLRGATPGEAGTPTSRTLTAQAGRWNNWPNWSNWANWRNG